MQIVLQLKVQPAKVTHDLQQTLPHYGRIDPYIDNDKVEWLLKDASEQNLQTSDLLVCHGILMRICQSVDDLADQPSSKWWGQSHQERKGQVNRWLDRERH